MQQSPGHLLRLAMQQQPLVAVGTPNAYCARLAQKHHFQAIYLSGAGLSNNRFGQPDIGLLSPEAILQATREITCACRIPLIVDCDTGWGCPLIIQAMVTALIQAEAAAIQLEDQEVLTKKCGHLPNKKLVSADEMTDRICAARSGRVDESFVVIARTDALASETLDQALARIESYHKAGADVIFVEAITSRKDLDFICKHSPLPVLVNMTEFGKTPLWPLATLGKAGASIALYPLTAQRLMNAAADHAYATLSAEGTQKSLIHAMETRQSLYNHLNYDSHQSLPTGRTLLKQFLKNQDKSHGNDN